MNRQSDQRSEQIRGFRRTTTDLVFGLGYGLSRDTTINFSVQANVSGSRGASVRFNVLYAFGKGAAPVFPLVVPTSLYTSSR